MKTTKAQFKLSLQQIVCEAAIQVAQHGSEPGTWEVHDGNPGFLAARKMSGHYTIPEMEAILADMKAVQARAEANARAAGLEVFADTPERQEWNRQCNRFGFTPADLNREFTTIRGERYRLTGFTGLRSKYDVAATRVRDGRKFKFESSAVRSYIAMQEVNRG